ncbi:hypothetical protein LINPERHAP2_LOCUS10600 [Linum perenne]
MLLMIVESIWPRRTSSTTSDWLMWNGTSVGNP